MILVIFATQNGVFKMSQEFPTLSLGITFKIDGCKVSPVTSISWHSDDGSVHKISARLRYFKWSWLIDWLITSRSFSNTQSPASREGQIGAKHNWTSYKSDSPFVACVILYWKNTRKKWRWMNKGGWHLQDKTPDSRRSACKAPFWHTLWQLWVLDRGDFSYCVRCTLLHENATLHERELFV